MTVLSAAQSAGIRLIGVKPSSLFSTTDPFSMELADLATEAAIDIARAADWQTLTKLATVTGDGVTVANNLPADYDRMPKKAQLHSSQFTNAIFQPARDLDAWFQFQQFSYSGYPGSWIVTAGKLQIYPALTSGATAKFYYITNKIISGNSKAAFTVDGDTFDLSERLLTLSLIWRWRSQKRMEYAEDMANYEKALSEEILKDKGSRLLVEGRARFPGDVRLAYPGSLGS